MDGSVRIQNSSLERKVTFLPISDLVTNRRNARTHSPRQIQEIARSIERFGFNNPVLIDERNQIVAGHGRVEAAKLLGRERVPTLRIGHLSDQDKRAFIIADNRLAEKAGWDPEVLAIELQGLIELDFDVGQRRENVRAVCKVPRRCFRPARRTLRGRRNPLRVHGLAPSG